MKILVTGGAGYVGSALCKRLLELHHDVIVYDSFKYGATPIIQYMWNSRFQAIRGDIRDIDKLAPWVRESDAVVHLAALVGAPICNEYAEEAIAVNDGATRVLANLCARLTKPLVFASSGSVYGKIDGFCTEDCDLSPLSTYGMTKAKAEPSVLRAGGTCLRFATLFGLSPAMRFDLLMHDIIYQAIRNKCFVMFQCNAGRTFLSINDAVDCYIHVLNDFSKFSGKVFNVGTERLNMSKEELAGKINDRYPFDLVRRNFSADPDQRDYAVKYERIESTGWKALRCIEDEIAKVGSLVELDRTEVRWRMFV